MARGKVLGKDLPCEVCGKIFYVSKSRLEKNKHHTCSKVCLGKLSSKLHSEKIMVPCQNCGKDIFYKKSHLKQIKIPSCSRACRSEIVKKLHKGKDNPRSLRLNDKERWFWEKAKDAERRAKTKGLGYDLDYKFLMEMFDNQQGLCHYSGIPMQMESKIGRKNPAASYDVASLDRKDSSLGYIRTNIVWSINCINMFKAHHDINDIKKVMKAIMIKEKEDIKVRIKKLFPDSKLPKNETPFNAGWDVFANRVEDCGDYIKVYSGIAIEPIGNFYFMLAPRSSIYKKGLTMYNNLGIIDNNYRGEIIGIFLKTDSYKEILPGERVMQLIPQELLQCSFELVEELSDTSRGSDGFGSTGV